MRKPCQRPPIARRSLHMTASFMMVLAVLALGHSAKGASWTNTGSLKTATLFHSSSLLPDGRVLVAGGQAATGVTNRAEVFNPATGIWTNTGAMSANRFAHTATLLRDGRVLVTGGFARGGFTNALGSAELYDPATGSWTNTGSMISPRAYHQAILLPGGKALVAGGGLHKLNILSSAEVYDPATGLWTATGAMNTNRVAFAAALLPDGHVLAAGGSPDADTAIRSSERYDPSTGRWTPTGDMSHERADLALAVLSDGSVLAIGGWGGNPELPPNTEVYNPTKGSWTAKGVLNAPRYNTRAVLLRDGKVLAAGGEVYDAAFSISEEFDQATGKWAVTGPLVTARRLHSLTMLANGSVLVAGGMHTDLLSSAEVYASSSTGPVGPVTLTSMSKTPDGAVQFGFTSVPIPGAAFTVYSSTNVAAPLAQWTARGGATEILPGRFQFTDSQATNGTQGFYSVRSP